MHDDFSRTPVASDHLRPWWYLLIIEMGVMISIPTFVLGGQLGLGMSFSDLIPATFCGALILGVLGACTAHLGAVTRCSTALISRLTFGARGSAAIALLLALGITGWWGVQVEMFADAVVQLARNGFSLSLPRELVILAGGMAMITTAALGIRAIGRLSYLAVPLLLCGLAYAFVPLITPGKLMSLWQFKPSPSEALSFGASAATVAGGFIVGASLNPDYARFARTNKHAIAYALTDYAFAYPLLLLVAAVIAVNFHSADIMIHLVPAGLTCLIFVMMMFATWAANDCNLYSSSLSLAAVFPKWKRAHLAIFAGIFGISLAELHVAGHMVSFLTLLGIVIAPISGIFVINNLGRKHAVTEEELASIPDWHSPTLIAWSGGVLLGFLATPKEALGLGLLKLTTIPTIDAILGAATIMLVLKLVRSKRQCKSAAKVEPAVSV